MFSSMRWESFGSCCLCCFAPSARIGPSVPTALRTLMTSELILHEHSISSVGDTTVLRPRGLSGTHRCLCTCCVCAAARSCRLPFAPETCAVGCRRCVCTDLRLPIARLSKQAKTVTARTPWDTFQTEPSPPSQQAFILFTACLNTQHFFSLLLPGRLESLLNVISSLGT